MVRLRQLLWIVIVCSTVFLNCALAQTALTQIQDTVHNPDGTLFSGTVNISFNGLAVPGTIAPQNTSAQIYTGALSVLLTPTTTAAAGAYYQAIFNSSNGLVTWTETWSVPPSTASLSLSQVRLSSTQGSGGTGGSGGSGGSGTGGGSGGSGGGISLPIQISDVTGLPSQLNGINASIAGLTSTANSLTTTVSGNTTSIATFNASLNSLATTVTGLTNATGTLSNTVSGLASTVNGIGNTVTSQGNQVTTLGNTVTSLSAEVELLTAGTTAALFTDSEKPLGVMDGSNTLFALAGAPAPGGSLQLYRNGLQQMSGVDFTLAGNTITFLSGNVPKTSDTVQAFYRTVGTGQTATFSDAEVPSGTVNGTNTTFTLSAPPNPMLGLKLFKNGMLLAQNGDYTLSGTTVTFTSTQVTPQAGDSIIAYYRY
jgi:uncharacterized protein YoxC